MSDYSAVEPTEKIDNIPHVSALLWDSIVGIPFQIDEVKKTRGRPRKLVETNIERTTHQMGDSEPETRNLLHTTVHKIILDYKEYVEEGMSPRLALEEVCKLYRVPYAQAFNICVDEI